jgi:hypothetical protein
MILILFGLIGGEIIILVGLIHMPEFKRFLSIGGIWLSLSSKEKCIFVVSIHTVNIEEQFMEHIYLEKTLRYVYLTIFMRMYGNIGESKKVIVNPHPQKTNKKGKKIEKEKKSSTISENLLQIHDLLKQMD